MGTPNPRYQRSTYSPGGHGCCLPEAQPFLARRFPGSRHFRSHHSRLSHHPEPGAPNSHRSGQLYICLWDFDLFGRTLPPSIQSSLFCSRTGPQPGSLRCSERKRGHPAGQSKWRRDGIPGLHGQLVPTSQFVCRARTELFTSWTTIAGLLSIRSGCPTSSTTRTVGLKFFTKAVSRAESIALLPPPRSRFLWCGTFRSVRPRNWTWSSI